MIFSLFLAPKTHCGYLLESPKGGSSNKYPRPKCFFFFFLFSSNKKDNEYLTFPNGVQGVRYKDVRT